LKSRKVLVIAVLVVLALVAAILIPKIMSPKKAGAVRVAINIPLTGPISAWSGQFPNGFKMGIEDATREYGLDPAAFTVDVQDNAGQPSQAVSIYNKQRINGFDAYISVATGPANAVAPQLDALGTPHFIAAFDPFIIKAAPSRLRVMANSKIEAPLFIQYAKARGAKSVYIIQLNLSYAEDEFGVIVQPALEKAGITVHREHFELADRDFKIIAEKAKASGDDLIFVCGYSFHLQPLLRDLRAAGLIQKGRVVSVQDFVDLTYSGTPVAELKDVIFVSPIFDVPGKVAKAPDWRKRYEERFNVKPTYVPAYAYDNATLIVRAYAKSHKVSTDTLIAAVPFDGVNGAINLDADHDILATVTLAELDDQGHVVELSH
jgi:branched-chain amino acid transport system substrate-binding protein